MSDNPSSISTDKETIQQRLRHFLPDRVWVGPDAIGGLVLYRTHPEHWQALEYMRVLTRKEVEKLAEGEGVDVQQLVSSYRRTIEGQRREISRLNEALRKKISDEAPSFSPNFDERNGL